MTLTPVAASSYTDSKPLLDKLPKEIICLVVSFVDVPGLQGCAGTSRYLSSVTIPETNKKKRNELKFFIGKVLSRLSDDTQLEQKQKLLILQSSINSDFPNLLELKQYIFSIKSEIIDVLMTLSEEELTALEDMPAPSFCENIWALAKIYKKIPVANSIPNEIMRGHALHDISKALIKAKDIDRAIEITNSIPDEITRRRALYGISRALIEAKDIDRAIEIANSIPDEFTRGCALHDISRALIKAKDIDRVIEMANSIPNEIVRGYALHDISKVLIEAKDIDRVIEMANSIPNEIVRGRILSDISKALIKAKDIDRAIEIANSIPNEITRRRALF